MKVKNIKITIKFTEAFLEEAKSIMNKIMAGEKVSVKKGLYFENLDAMRKALQGDVPCPRRIGPFRRGRIGLSQFR